MFCQLFKRHLFFFNLTTNYTVKDCTKKKPKKSLIILNKPCYQYNLYNCNIDMKYVSVYRYRDQFAQTFNIWPPCMPFSHLFIYVFILHSITSCLLLLFILHYNIYIKKTLIFYAQTRDAVNKVWENCQLTKLKSNINRIFLLHFWHLKTCINACT